MSGKGYYEAKHSLGDTKRVMIRIRLQSRTTSNHVEKWVPFSDMEQLCHVSKSLSQAFAKLLRNPSNSVSLGPSIHRLQYTLPLLFLQTEPFLTLHFIPLINGFQMILF